MCNIRVVLAEPEVTDGGGQDFTIPNPGALDPSIKNIEILDTNLLTISYLVLYNNHY